MGKMVADTRAAIDALVALDAVDASRIALMGYSLGAKVGILTMAMDERVHALASVCGFDPLRLDTAGSWSRRHTALLAPSWADAAAWVLRRALSQAGIVR